jgi:type 1 glutamine amidotransferase
MKRSLAAVGFTLFVPMLSASADSGTGWVSFKGADGPGKGKHVVLLAGDEEYRSEEALPMLAKILSQRHGFNCTVLFSVDDDGTINPNRGESVGKPETLDSADAIVMSLRFRKWPDAAMKHFDDAIQRGVPVVGLRTSTHAFQLPDSSAFKEYNNFGKKVLGEQWVSHWGNHGGEATIGRIDPKAKSNPLVSGIQFTTGLSDVYEAYPPDDATILLLGEVQDSMDLSKPAPAKREKKRASDGQTQDINTPMMPVAWSREVKNSAGKTNKILCSTMGAANDLESEDLRRLVINGVYWGLDLKVPAKANAEVVGSYKPSNFAFNGFKKDTKAADYELAK